MEVSAIGKVKMDILKKRFGLLVAMEPVGRSKQGHSIWRCECDCGNKDFKATRSHLITGATSSCGCQAGKPIRDIRNQRFGMLVAMEPVGSNKAGSILWRCECDCGNKSFIASSASLVHNNRENCGCVALQQEKEFMSRKYGMLRVIKKVPRPPDARKKESYYLCECDCTNSKIVMKSLLVNEVVKSCGCLRVSEAPKKLQYTLVNKTNVGCIASTAPQKNNRSGVRGVCPYQGQWRAQIGFQGVKYYLGTYKTIEEAAKVRQEAEDRLHGPFLDWFEQNIRPLPKREKRA